MKLEEKIINNVLHYRWYSDANFKPYTAEELTSKLYVEHIKSIPVKYMEKIKNRNNDH